jgi:hypothetical protein
MNKTVPINEYVRGKLRRNIIEDRNNAKIKDAIKIDVPIAIFS